MKHYRFYRECVNSTEKRKLRATDTRPGTVIAVEFDKGYWTGNSFVYSCVASLTLDPNAPVCSSDVSPEYLQTVCKRISEDVARKIHPRIFAYLEANDE